MSARLIAKVVAFRHFYLRNGRAARSNLGLMSNQHVHKYCIALSPERHHGPWHTAVFTGWSYLPLVTREATTSFITLSLSPSRGGSIVMSLYSCRPKNGEMRGNARQRPKHDEYCVTSFGLRRPWHFAAVEGVVSSATGAAPRSPIEKPRETDEAV